MTTALFLIILHCGNFHSICYTVQKYKFIYFTLNFDHKYAYYDQ